MSAGDETIFETMIKVENKDIFVDLKKNRSGIYLKISERNGTSRNTVLIPASGIPRLKKVLEDVAVVNVKSKGVSRERRNRVSQDPEITSRSVYVTGLSWDTDDQELLEHFSQAGAVVNATVLRQRRLGNSKSSMGCGVVELASRDIAVNAVTLLNESELKGRTIRCREDRDPEEDSPSDDAPADATAAAAAAPARKSSSKKPARNADEPRVAEPNKVFVTSLTWDTTDADLSQLFGTVGTVVASEILSTRKGRSMGSGIVEFGDPASVAAAISSFNNVDFKGRTIVVREYYQ